MKKNYFLFNGDFYLQIHGTAMGTPCAPNYTNIFMENLEHQILSTAPGGRTAFLWKQYIDDIYVIWTHSLDNLHDLHSHMNRLHYSIQFKMDFSMRRTTIPQYSHIFQHLRINKHYSIQKTNRCLLPTSRTILSPF